MDFTFGSAVTGSRSSVGRTCVAYRFSPISISPRLRSTDCCAPAVCLRTRTHDMVRSFTVLPVRILLPFTTYPACWFPATRITGYRLFDLLPTFGRYVLPTLPHVATSAYNTCHRYACAFIPFVFYFPLPRHSPRASSVHSYQLRYLPTVRAPLPRTARLGSPTARLLFTTTLAPRSVCTMLLPQLVGYQHLPRGFFMGLRHLPVLARRARWLFGLPAATSFTA